MKKKYVCRRNMQEEQKMYEEKRCLKKNMYEEKTCIKEKMQGPS